MNLLLISIDSLRHDYVARVNPSIVSPRFNELTRNFHYYENCFSISSATRPVHVSLMSGLYPFEHGILSQRHKQQNPNISMLFDLLRLAGFSCAGYSEAIKIFHGLNLGAPIHHLDPQPEIGLSQLRQAITSPTGRQCLFLHYWSTHTPYGASDGLATGETAKLLATGQRKVVIERYTHSVQQVFECKIAPLLTMMDLSDWVIVILGDHGESWTSYEPYHGLTLDNSVLRVPLFVHIPFQTFPAKNDKKLVSLVDLFPTIIQSFSINYKYMGYGQPLQQTKRKYPYYLAQIVPIHANISDVDQSPESKSSITGPLEQAMLWSLLNVEQKFTYDENAKSGELRNTLTEQPLEVPAGASTCATYLQHYQDIVTGSAYNSTTNTSTEHDILLDQRLRDLGYL